MADPTADHFSVTIGPFVTRTSISPHQKHRLREIKHHFTPDVLDKVLFPLLTQAKPASLRLLDWLAVNYSKRKTISYVVRFEDHGDEHFDLHRSYQQWLRNFRRKVCDGLHVYCLGLLQIRAPPRRGMTSFDAESAFASTQPQEALSTQRSHSSIFACGCCATKFLTGSAKTVMWSRRT